MPSWGGYKNGEIPLAALTKIDPMFVSGGGAVYAAPNLAAAIHTLEPLFALNLHGETLKVNSAYRSRAAQQNILDHPGEAWGKIAAVGTSDHGWGTSVDFGSHISNKNSPEHKWMQANAPRYGLTNTGSAFGEPGHWSMGAGSSNGSTQLPTDAVLNAGGSVLDTFGAIGKTLSDPLFWKRAGIFTIGVVFIIIVISKLVAPTPVGGAIKTATTAALL